jgi:ABC-type transport system involved in multi-copper enzyme maturation permease subunit
VKALFEFFKTNWAYFQMVLGAVSLALLTAGALSRKVLAITLNTMREELRKKVLYFLVLFAVVFIAFSGAAAKVQPGREGEAVAQAALFVVGLFGMLVTIFSATAVLFSEIRSRTIFVLFSHPVWSFHIIMGKFLGVTAIVFISVFLMGAVLVAYLAFTPWLALVGTLIPAMALIFFQLMLLTAMCVLGSTFLSRITNILLSMVLFFVGSGHSFFKGVTDLMKVAVVKYYIQVFLFLLPDFEKFAVRSKMFDPDFPFDATYVLSAMGDAVFRAAVMVALGIFFFRLKEVGTERWE